MFSGIIGATLPLRSLQTKPGNGATLLLARNPAFVGNDPVQLGESLALNGVCLTLSRETDQDWEFDLSAETLSKTNLNELKPGQRVNIERALKVSDRLSGHWVQGHVDGVARMLSSRAAGECWELTFLLPYSLGRLCVEKGSIAIDGTSLTVNSVISSLASDGVEISVMVIPHTWNGTNLSELQVGSPVNIENDILAKYMEKLCHR